MARTATPAEEPAGRPERRSDGEPAKFGFLGGFDRGPARFAVFELGPGLDGGRDFPNRFLIDVDDGAGPRECCRFTDAPDDEPVWNRAWNGDDWCPWILERARALIPDIGI